MAEKNHKLIEFDVHKNVIEDLIQSQNGTLATAIRELIMNSVDAGATSIEIELTDRAFAVIDNGAGFGSREDIESNFRVFGQPHEQGDAVYGRFRIGRGQIMAFAAVDWVSNAFTMHVDIKQHGYGFQLTEHDESVHDGCRVAGELYTQTQPWEFNDICKTLRDLVRYSPIKITLNGYGITQNPEAEHWDIDNENFRIRWSSVGDVAVYNLGIFVRDLSFYNVNTGGIVVTKQPLQLNMARNEVTRNDELWMDIERLVREKGQEDARKAIYSRKPSASDRQNIIRQFCEMQLEDGTDIGKIPLLPDIRGHSLSLNHIATARLPVTVCPTEARTVGERVATDNGAIVLHPSVQTEWDELLWEIEEVEASHIMHAIAFVLHEYGFDQFADLIAEKQCVPFEALAKEYELENSQVAPKDYSDKEKIAIRSLNRASSVMAKGLGKVLGHEINKRRVRLGSSDTAAAWTDGYRTIWVDRNRLKSLDRKGNVGGTTLALDLLHEYLHSPGDSDDCAHNFEFYKIYHDLTGDKEHIIGSAAHAIEKSYIEGIKREELKPPKAVLEYHRTLGHVDKKTSREIDYRIYLTLVLREGAKKLSRFDEIVLKKMINVQPKKESYWNERAMYKLELDEQFGAARGMLQYAKEICPDIEVPDGYRRRASMIKMAKEQAIPVLLKKHPRIGVSKAWWEALLECSGIEDVVGVLIDCPASNVKGCRKRSHLGIDEFVSDSFIQKHEIESPRHAQFGWWDESIWERHGRLQRASSVIEYAYSMLRDPEERQELGQLFFSDEGRARLDKWLVDPEGDSRSSFERKRSHDHEWE